MAGIEPPLGPPENGSPIPTSSELLEEGALAVATGGTSAVLKVKMTLLSIGVVLAVLLGVFVLLIITGAKATAQSGEVTPSCTFSDAAAPPNDLIPFYDDAADEFHLGDQGWAMLAAINKEESDFGTSNAKGVHSGDNGLGAAGPMQIGIGGKATNNWATYGVDADHDGVKDVYNADDAIHGAARKLAADGAPKNWPGAIKAYNNDPQYIQDVQDYAATYQGECQVWSYAAPTTDGPAAVYDPKTQLASVPDSAPEPVQKMIAAANRIAHKPYTYGGGHSPGWEHDSYDCSAMTSYVLHAGGVLDSVLTSQDFSHWDQEGAGQWVTVWATKVSNDDVSVAHVFLVIAGLRLDTGSGGGVGRPNGSAWRPADQTDARSYAGFYPRHPPGL